MDDKIQQQQKTIPKMGEFYSVFLQVTKSKVTTKTKLCNKPKKNALKRRFCWPKGQKMVYLKAAVAGRRPHSRPHA